MKVSVKASNEIIKEYSEDCLCAVPVSGDVILHETVAYSVVYRTFTDKDSITIHVVKEPF